MEKNIFELAKRKGLSVVYSLSGHIYRDSVYETSDSCGNCDGGNCDCCTPRWLLYKDEKLVGLCSDKEELEEVITEL